MRVHSGEGPEISNQIVREGKGSPADLVVVENSPELGLLDEHHLLAPVAPATLARVPRRVERPAAQRGFQLTGFHLLRDTVLTPGQGVHGVRVIFDYTFPTGSTDTFDQIALTNADETEVYLLVTHCIATCYRQHQSEIETVMTSFTVRSQ